MISTPETRKLSSYFRSTQCQPVPEPINDDPVVWNLFTGLAVSHQFSLRSSRRRRQRYLHSASITCRTIDLSSELSRTCSCRFTYSTAWGNIRDQHGTYNQPFMRLLTLALSDGQQSCIYWSLYATSDLHGTNYLGTIGQGQGTDAYYWDSTWRHVNCL